MAWLGILSFEDVYGCVRSRNFIIAGSISFFPASLCPMRERRKKSGISCIECSSLISRACSGGWPAHALSSTVLLLRADRSRLYQWSLSHGCQWLTRTRMGPSSVISTSVLTYIPAYCQSTLFSATGKHRIWTNSNCWRSLENSYFKIKITNWKVI